MIRLSILQDMRHAGQKSMPNRSSRFCAHTGCGNIITAGRYCEVHQADEIEAERQRDRKRGGSRERGYTWKWDQYSRRYLMRPENQTCKLHLPGCTLLATCVDHIVAVTGPDDPRFFDPTNHQSSCSHCNTVKGKRTIKGTFEL